MTNFANRWKSIFKFTIFNQNNFELILNSNHSVLCCLFWSMTSLHLHKNCCFNVRVHVRVGDDLNWVIWNKHEMRILLENILSPVHNALNIWRTSYQFNSLHNVRNRKSYFNVFHHLIIFQSSHCIIIIIIIFFITQYQGHWFRKVQLPKFCLIID